MIRVLIVSTLLCCQLASSSDLDDNIVSSSCCKWFYRSKGEKSAEESGKKEPEYCATLTTVKPRTDSANKYNPFEELEKTIITLRRCIKHHDFTLSHSAAKSLSMQLISFFNDDDSIENLKHLQEICIFLEDLSILFESTKKMDYEAFISSMKISFSHICHLISKISSPLVAIKAFSSDLESVYSVAKQCVLLYERLEKEKNIKLITAQDKHSKFTFVDQQHFFDVRRVLHHLLKNAVKSTKTIESPYISLYLSVLSDRDQHTYRFTISDNGVGIPDSARKNWHKSQYDQKTGFGFWLYTCKSLITKMGGTINFISEIGRGTTFWVSMPCIEIQE